MRFTQKQNNGEFARLAARILQITGQVLSPLVSGGNSSGGNLTLQSTTHSTKGKIFLGSLSAYDEANFRLGVGNTSPSYTFDMLGNINMTAVTAPTATTVALAGLGAGNLTNGIYYYRITFVTSLGETQVGTVSSSVTVADATTDGQVSLTAIPTGPTGTTYTTTQRKIYRTKVGGVLYYLLATIADNTTTTYTDNIADASITTETNYGKKSSGGLIYFDGTPIISCVSCSSYGGINTFYSTFIGWNSGNLTSSSGNTGIGSECLQSLTTGGSNMAIGSRAIRACTTGSSNVGIGASSLSSLTTGSSNIAIGTLAGISISTGSESVYIGQQSGQGTGTGNTAIGTFSMLAGGTGSLATAFGYYSFAFGSGGVPGSGTAIGWGAGLSAGSSATGFTGLGRRAGAAVTTGANNTHIGFQSGDSDGTTASTGTLANVTTLGYNAQVTQANSLILGGLSANGFGVSVGINTTAPAAKLHVISTTEQLRIGYDGSNYYSTTVGSTGIVTFNAVGTGSSFIFSDGISLPYVAKTGTYTATNSDYCIDCTSGTFTVNLPAVSGLTGRIYVIKNSGAGVITLDGDGSEVIDQQLTQTMAAGASLTVQNTGTAWIII